MRKGSLRECTRGQEETTVLGENSVLIIINLARETETPLFCCWHQNGNREKKDSKQCLSEGRNPKGLIWVCDFVVLNDLCWCSLIGTGN